MLQLIIHGQVKPKSMYRPLKGRYGGTYLDKEWGAWRDRAVMELVTQTPPQFRPFEGPTAIDVTFFMNDRRRRDSDNLLKSVFHLLVKAGIVLDDSQFIHGEWCQYVAGVKHAGAVIRLESTDYPHDVPKDVHIDNDQFVNELSA